MDSGGRVTKQSEKEGRALTLCLAQRLAQLVDALDFQHASSALSVAVVRHTASGPGAQ
jgi:hypothetical protein